VGQSVSRVTIDLTGRQIDQWAVVRSKFRTRNNGRHETMWLCLCSCGNTKWVAAHSLLSGQSTRCRRHAHPERRTVGQAFQEVFEKYKRDAVRRGYCFSLTKHQVINIMQQSCFYCGKEPSNVATARHKTDPERFVYSGIDRRNNNAGYTPDNCVPCCCTCNRSKLALSAEEFITMCVTIASRFR
jgi:hypothetical protein